MRVLLQVFEDTNFAGGTPTFLCLANGTWRRDVEEVLKLMDSTQLPQCLWMETVYDDVSPLDIPALNAEIALFMDKGNTSACIIKATPDGPDTLLFRGALRQWKPPAPASTVSPRDRSTSDIKSPDRGAPAGWPLGWLGSDTWACRGACVGGWAAAVDGSRASRGAGLHPRDAVRRRSCVRGVQHPVIGHGAAPVSGRRPVLGMSRGLQLTARAPPPPASQSCLCSGTCPWRRRGTVD